MKKRPHKFNIGESYGIWNDGKKTHKNFPRVFLRKSDGDSAGKFDPGDAVVMFQPCSGLTFGPFRIAWVTEGDFGGGGLRYKITVAAAGEVEAL